MGVVCDRQDEYILKNYVVTTETKYDGYLRIMIYDSFRIRKKKKINLSAVGDKPLLVSSITLPKLKSQT